MLRDYFPKSSWLKDEISTGTVPIFYIVTSNSKEEEVPGVRKALNNDSPEKIVNALEEAMKDKLKDLPKDEKDVRETINSILNSIKNLKTAKEAATKIKKEEEKEKNSPPQAAQDIRAIIGSSSGQDTPNPGGYNYGYGYI